MQGFPMSVPTRDGAVITLRPALVEEAASYAEGFSSYPTARTLTMRAAMSVESEMEWIRNQDKDPNTCGWGIYLEDELIGNTGLAGIDNRRASSGCCIYRRDLWGRGIISAVHHARMFYADQVLGLEAVDSFVFFGNDASQRALERVGYTTYGTRFNVGIVDGQVTHAHQLLWVNPAQDRWKAFWGGPVPPEHANAFKAGRQRASRAMRWAAKNVTFL
ncbi:GNAT family N-acetyltransferase [Candidatus Saccharibacteria bacterium]|nr:GNAT family N-acetyltransferase [Candidatus Saccharibacteria bacterium]